MKDIIRIRAMKNNETGEIILQLWDAPIILKKNKIRLLAIVIDESELTEIERKNIDIANVFGHRTLDEFYRFFEKDRKVYLGRRRELDEEED